MSQIKKLESSLLYPVKAGYRMGFCVFWKKYMPAPTIFFVFLTYCLIGLPGCKEDEPEIIETDKQGKRDYVWSIDSVDYGNLPSTIQLESIWGSTSTDVWGAAGDAPDVRDCLWHYDGVKWTRATEGTPITEPTGNKVVYAVWGSARNDVWAVGRKIKQGVLSAFIMHFDGTRWVDATPSNVTALKSNLYNIYGFNKKNIWVAGYEYALQYDGNQWRTYKLADSMIVASITKNSRDIYFSIYSPWGGDSYFIYRFEQGNFITIDTTKVFQSKFGLWLWAKDSSMVSFSNAIIIAKILNSGNIHSQSWRREIETESFFGNPMVYDKKNVFVVGQWNLIYHWNGNDWKQIFINISNHSVDPRGRFYGVWTEGNEVFICDVDNGIVYHGR